MEVHNEINAPATLLLRKEPKVPNKQEAHWAPQLVWMQWQSVVR